MFLNAAASLMARLATESKGPVTGRMTEIKEMAGMDVCSEKTEALALHKLSADKIIEILHRVHAATITRALSFGVIVKKITCDQLAIAKTGDTVYDAPALKKADIAIAIADTIDAARSSSDILLTKPGHQRMENYTVSGIIQPIACLLLLCLLVLPFVSALTNPQEVQVLQGMYASLNLSSVGDPCKDSWKGIRCSESSVVSIELARQDLNGTLGGNLFGLQNLKKLDLSYNNIEGAIPLSLPPNATHINLAFNKFNQSIPFSLNPMKYLESLNVSHNALSCQLGNVFTGFPSLKQLDLSYNSFTGKLPNSISTSTNLTSLFLQRNMFEGSVALLEHLPLKDLWIQMNEFSGPIPQTFWNITNLRVERNYFRDDVPHVLGRGGEEDGEISSPEGDGKIKPPMADNVPTKKNGMTKIFYGLLWGFIALVVVCGGGVLIWYCWYRKKSTTGGSIELGKQRFKCN